MAEAGVAIGTTALWPALKLTAVEGPAFGHLPGRVQAEGRFLDADRSHVEDQGQAEARRQAEHGGQGDEGKDQDAPAHVAAPAVVLAPVPLAAFLHTVQIIE